MKVTEFPIIADSLFDALIVKQEGGAVMNERTLDNEIVRLDKWDYIIAISSGIITAAADVFWVKDISLLEARKWGVKETNNFVLHVAHSQGYKGTDLFGAVKHLEDLYPIPGDKLTNDFGGGKQHHLRDFSHHPTIVGFMFSILTQFSGMGYGTDSQGSFKSYPIPSEDIAKGGALEKLYYGTVAWIFHMISDVAGSSSSVVMGKEGTGLPGPLMSLIKELSSIPIVKDLAGKDNSGNCRFSKVCSKLFNGTLLGEHDENGHIVKDGDLKFDLRTEIGIGHEMVDKKQYLPVLLNDLIVRAFYSIRRFIKVIEEHPIKTNEDIKCINTSAFLPWGSKQLTHMLLISSASYSVIDISIAGIKAAVKNKNNRAGFTLDFIHGINYFGVGKLTLAVGGEAYIGIELLHERFLEFAENQLARIDLSREEAEKMITGTASKIGYIAGIGSPVGFVSAAIAVYKEISSSLEEYRLAKGERFTIQQRCAQNVSLILENREQIEAATSQYIETNLTVFSDAFNDINRAIAANSSDGFIAGNNRIQNQLGKSDSFTSQSEFDSLMKSEDNFKL